MPFNGSGVFQRLRNWVADATAGIKIRADYHDSEDDNFAAGISNCIARDGQTIVTQNIPWNSKRITGLADPVNAQDAATKAFADTKVSAAGGTMTGDLIITKNDPMIVLNSTNAAGMTINTQKNGKMRWSMHLGDANAEPETGGNTGSDFKLLRFADDENLLGDVLYFDRQTGLGTVFADPVVPLGIATKKYADGPKTMTGQLTTVSATQAIGAPTGMGTIEVKAVGGAGAGITFNIPGTTATNFGLDPSGYFVFGGIGSPTYRFWTTREFATHPATVEALEELKQRIEALERK